MGAGIGTYIDLGDKQIQDMPEAHVGYDMVFIGFDILPVIGVLFNDVIDMAVLLRRQFLHAEPEEIKTVILSECGILFKHKPEPFFLPVRQKQRVYCQSSELF